MTIENLSCLSNEFAVQADWLRIPYGDHPHYTGAIQRLTRQTAEVMANDFHSFRSRLGRLFGGLPVYIGHPDDPELANQYQDKKSYAWLMDMDARDDGLYIKPKWSPPGEELISNAHYKWFSPRWGCKALGNENGKRTVAPVRLISIGLTNNPQIEGILPLANEEIPALPEKGTMKDKIIKLLGLSNEATEDQILAAATALKTSKDTAEVTLANEKTLVSAAQAASTAKDSEISNLKSQISAATTNLANERKARIEAVLDNAVVTGKITAAQRPQWAADLAANFDAKLVELSNAKPVLNTNSRTQGLGGRNSDTVSRQDKILTLVNEKMSAGMDYDTAWGAVKKANPALFEEPKGKEG